MKFTLTDKQVRYIYDLAKQRHDAKHASFRNSYQIMAEDKSDHFEEKFKIDKQYLSHFLGLVGELAWSLKSDEPVDEQIYKVRDGGEDFKGIEVKTITYFGSGEPELKIKVREYDERKPPKKYVLVRFNLKTREVEILGTITRMMFDRHKVVKKYGRYLPTNYVVPVSKMRKIKNEH